MTTQQATLALSMRPAIGARVEIQPHRIIGEIVAVRDCLHPRFWFLDIMPETAISERELERGVHSSKVSYVDPDGTRRPLSPASALSEGAVA